MNDWLPRDFYLNEDVVTLARSFLGKVLVTEMETGRLTAGIITETEAYKGPEDRASHAWNNRRTQRTETMYKSGGVGYIYLCYGMHHLFNIVTGPENLPHAVLIRAILPVEGIDIMENRRKKKSKDKGFSTGPGSVSKALGITTAIDGISLLTKTIHVEDRGIELTGNNIIAGPRVGIDYAGEDAKLPWRFRLQSIK
jgi:DNA-3-methyladenine glycosylase